MNYATAWFLVMIGGQQYIGPLGAESCQNAARALQSEGIVCRQAAAMTACPAPGIAGGGTYMACPVFDFPQVTRKP
jgi:hypothetical protein